MIRWDIKMVGRNVAVVDMWLLKKFRRSWNKKHVQIVCAMKWMHVYSMEAKFIRISWDLLLSNRYHFQFSKISQRSHFFITISQQSLLHSLFKFGHSNHALVNHGLFFYILKKSEAQQRKCCFITLPHFTLLYSLFGINFPRERTEKWKYVNY